jgi:hypothetical protein
MRNIKYFCAILLSLSFAACGGGASGAYGGSSATASYTYYSISGTVTFSGNPLAGATISLTGTRSGSTTTDSSGNYSFTGLSNGSYTVTPSGFGYTYAPTSIAVTMNGANVTGKNFAG